MEKAIVSAPGKIILAGEHAVVYGQPAIVAAIDKRITVKIDSAKTSQKTSGLVKFAVAVCMKYLTRSRQDFNIAINSELPIGCGLGSSAALATALVWALLPHASLKEKNQLVKTIEDYQHGNSSGVDQTIVREGGFLRFQKGVFQPIKLLIKQVILINSGRPKESTGEMVKMVAKGNYQKEFKQIGEISNYWDQKLIQENERLLEKLGVVGEKAKKMIRQIELIGGLAKVCGAGGVKAGSGMLLAVHPEESKLLQLIKQNNWQYLRVKLGGPGVRYEKN